MGAAQRDEASREVEERHVRRVPVVPRQLRVVTVGVVVARLRATQLVAAEEHRHALREEERGQQVALLAGAQREDGRVVGRPFHAAVPGSVVRLAVPVVVPVGAVVLAVVGDQVGQREAIVRGHEIDARRGSPAIVLVEVGAAREAATEVVQHVRLATPHVAHRVPVATVPLGPVGRELAHLVATLTDVPGLRDELDRADDGVLLDDVEEGREAVHGMQLARQRRGQVEAEAIHVHLFDPVAQAVHDELEHVGLEHVERVAAAGVVHVAAAVVGEQAVVGLVVEAAERQRRAVVRTFARVVVDDVQDDLQPGRVEGHDHGLELVHLSTP